MSPRSLSLLAVASSTALLLTSPRLAAQADQMTGEQLYGAACALCHGQDGAGAPRDQVAFDTPLPDFSDCSFASREPSADWVAVSHQGGPVRGFDETMPAFGEALTEDQLSLAVEYLRTFCNDDRWPRGELNLPRPLLTEKAYPEDEAVTTVTVAAEGPAAIFNTLLFEKRFGPKSQIEVELPFGRVEDATGASHAGLGDVAVGLKHTLWHSFESGTILSLGGEAVLPTGSEDDGLGGGAVVVEPFLAFGKILPSDGFLHLQGLVEHPFEDGADNEAVVRGALGLTRTSGEWGRSWTPMLEFLASRDLESGATAHLDLIPQMQVSLNTRQHVLVNAGVRLPVNDTAGRPTQVIVYLLWDWFDGGFFDGW